MTLKTLQDYKQDKELERRTWRGGDLVEKKCRDILLPIACPCVSKVGKGGKKGTDHKPWTMEGQAAHRTDLLEVMIGARVRDQTTTPPHRSCRNQAQRQYLN